MCCADVTTSHPITYPRLPSAPESVSERLARLQSLCLALTAAATVRQTASVVIAEGFAALEAAAGSLYLLETKPEAPDAPAVSHFAHYGATGFASFPEEGYPRLSLEADAPLPDAARQRRPLFLESVVEASERKSASSVVSSERGKRTPAALAALPLLVEDRVVGGMELHWAQNRAFAADERAFMEIVAQICAQALERAHLYEAEQEARQIAERAEKRAALLQSVTARLSQALSAAQVAEVIVDGVAETLNAHRGVLVLLMPDGRNLETARALGYRSEVAQAWQQFALDAPIPLSEVARTGSPVWLHNLAERDARYPQLARIHTTSHAYAVLPLLAQERVLGAISFGFDHARAFDESERAFIETITQQCAQALERARLHDATAQTLAEIEALNVRLRRSMAETHHRVKNNLQVISALVELQAEPGTPFVSVDALRRIGSHAHALASLHDLLTDQAKSGAEINVISARALLGKMIPLLQAATGERPFETHIEDARLPVRIGSSLCLLVNELVSNAIKHGGKRIRLSLTTQPLAPEPGNSAPASEAPLETGAVSEMVVSEIEAAEALREAFEGSDRRGPEAPSSPRLVRLEIADDGPGFPAGFDVRTAANTGLDLVANISRLDLNGQVTFANGAEGGALVAITFPLPAS